ncbi:DNA repair metallo-beta-lactamase-domain-containing protein [Syncephalis plumigaleata]|nr:DNA repair metallo-beta-lactamase-domain-containing protein [Syncephalis plumigaleata]
MSSLDCPICQEELKHLLVHEREKHVNQCIDALTQIASEPLDQAGLSDSSSPSITTNIEKVESVSQVLVIDNIDTSNNGTSKRRRNASNKIDDSAGMTKGKPAKSPKPATPRRPCPSYKWVQDTSFTVDAFSYGAIEGCSAYFLTHFHSDHYQGLNKSFNHGIIYCTSVTANLVVERLKVSREQLCTLPLDTPVMLDTVRVTLIDANHCPGAVIILFEVPDTSSPDGWRRHLHTGDFRAIPDHVKHDAIAKCPALDMVYLDTTYLDPSYAFPAQSSVLEAVMELARTLNDKSTDVKVSKQSNFLMKWIRQGDVEIESKESKSITATTTTTSSRVLFVVGTYLIGKERVFQAIANAIGSKIYVTEEKRRILNCLEDKALTSLLTTKPNEANVHIVAMNQLNKASLIDYLDHYKKAGFTSLVAFRPTGWTYKTKREPDSNEHPDSCTDNDMVASGDSSSVVNGTITWPSSIYSVESLQPTKISSDIATYSVPYSEHSSFDELGAFIRSLSIRGRVQPTVNLNNEAARRRMTYWLGRWMLR